MFFFFISFKHNLNIVLFTINIILSRQHIINKENIKYNYD